MEEEKKLPVNLLNKESDEITLSIIAEKDLSKLEDLTKLFELNQQKKDIVRRNKLSKLIDIVDDELVKRVEVHPEDIDNDLLLKYMTQTTQVMTNIRLGAQEKPLIQIQNNELNVNQFNLSAESRKRVLDAVQELMKNALQGDIIDEERPE